MNDQWYSLAMSTEKNVLSIVLLVKNDIISLHN